MMMSGKGKQRLVKVFDRFERPLNKGQGLQVAAALRSLNVLNHFLKVVL